MNGLCNTCHTCEFRYVMTARFCPGCGKRLGGSPRREGRGHECEVWDDASSKHDSAHWYRCTSCKRTFEHVYNGGRNESFCPNCGARIVAWYEVPYTVPRGDFAETADSAREAYESYATERGRAIWGDAE